MSSETLDQTQESMRYDLRSNQISRKGFDKQIITQMFIYLIYLYFFLLIKHLTICQIKILKRNKKGDI